MAAGVSEPQAQGSMRPDESPREGASRRPQGHGREEGREGP